MRLLDKIAISRLIQTITSLIIQLIKLLEKHFPSKTDNVSPKIKPNRNKPLKNLINNIIPSIWRNR